MFWLNSLGGGRLDETDHSRDLSIGLQELDDLTLVGGLDAGEQSTVSYGSCLVVMWQVVKLTTSEGLALCALCLAEHSDTTADGLCGRLRNITNIINKL